MSGAELVVFEADAAGAAARWSLVIDPLSDVDGDGRPSSPAGDVPTLDGLRELARWRLMEAIPGRRRAGMRARLWIRGEGGQLWLAGEWAGTDGGWHARHVESRQLHLVGDPEVT